MAGFLAILAVIGFIVGAIYFCIGTIILAIGVHLGADRTWVLYGAWLSAFVLLVLLALSGAAWGSFTAGASPSPIDTSTTQDANAQIRFTDAFVGARPIGPSYCWRREAGAAVVEMATQNVDMQSDWRWGPGLNKYVRASMRWDPPGVGDGTLSLGFADRSLMSAADYQASMGGAVAGTVAADGSSGQITFTDLPHHPDRIFDPAIWPDTISGTLSWSCAGPERTANPE